MRTTRIKKMAAIAAALRRECASRRTLCYAYRKLLLMQTAEMKEYAVFLIE